jgi:cytochrome c-type biogenesis protein CcmH/NrfF
LWFGPFVLLFGVIAAVFWVLARRQGDAEAPLTPAEQKALEQADKRLNKP